MSNLEKLQAEMPHVFELRDKLMNDIASGEAAVRERLNDPRLSDGERREMWAKFHASVRPIRGEIDRINEALARIIAFMPPSPIHVQQKGD